jgi:hypothetical protein
MTIPSTDDEVGSAGPAYLPLSVALVLGLAWLYFLLALLVEVGIGTRPHGPQALLHERRP